MAKRRIHHLWVATKDKRHNHFGRALREFGPDSFDFEVLEFCEKEKLLEREKFWIQFMDAASENGFNTRKNPTALYRGGVSELTRQRISLSKTGEKWTEERKAKHKLAMAGVHTGRRLSVETRNKISETLKGSKLSPESIEKRTRSRAGYTHSEETRQKMSESQKGKVFSIESREKIRQAKLGKKRAPESVEKQKETRNLQRESNLPR